MSMLSRRHFLTTAVAGSSLAAFLPGGLARAAVPPKQLTVTTRILEVDGKPAKVFALLGPDGKPGLRFTSGDRFNVDLRNHLDQPTLIHWHGLTPPNADDGMPGLTQPALAPGASYRYDFRLTRPGTNFMHSHVGLQEQQLLSAPLIIADPAEAHLDEQEVVMNLHDFTFRDPAAILAELQKGMAHQMSGDDANKMQMTQMQMDEMQSGQMQVGQAGGQMPGMDMSPDEMAQMPGMPQNAPIPAPKAAGDARMDVNDVQYDAFLANDRTYQDPEVITVEQGGRIRLRVINAAASSNFMIDLGDLTADLIAVDGMPVQVVHDRQFAVAVGQRIDLRLQLPSGGGAWPVIAQLEGDRRRSAVILATKAAPIATLDFLSDKPTGRFDQLTGHLVAARDPLPQRAVDRHLSLDLTGDMMRYRWGLMTAGAAAPLLVKKGERVTVELINRTAMSHPMHLHGHHFQLVAVNGQAVAGPLRDTHLVPAGSSATIAFDADNPGNWAFHCHNLYHMAAGMMTELRYV
jgi:FtsP/CotA-like multicopper oxidase with cupredoxin domain